jgi:hypothetical protein
MVVQQINELCGVMLRRDLRAGVDVVMSLIHLNFRNALWSSCVVRGAVPGAICLHLCWYASPPPSGMARSYDLCWLSLQRQIRFCGPTANALVTLPLGASWGSTPNVVCTGLHSE